MNNFQRYPALRYAVIATAIAATLALLWTLQPVEVKAGDVADLEAALAPLPDSLPVSIDGKPVVVERSGAGVVLVGRDVVVPPPVVARSVYGSFALQPGDGRTISEAQLKLPGVDGLTIRIRPEWISKNGKWDWTFPDASVARCHKTNDAYTLLLMGGAKDPLKESNLAFYESAAAAMGQRYASDPLCVGVHCTGSSPSGHSEELFWGRPMPSDAKAATRRMIDAWTAAFPQQVKLLAGSANDPAAMQELIRYGVQKAGGRFLYKSNAMKASTDLGWQGNQLVVWAAKNGAMPGWEFVGSWTHERQRFGGPFQKAFDNMDVLTDQAGLMRRQSYRAVYGPDLNLLGGVK